MEIWILPLITLIPLLGAVIILFILRAKDGIKVTAIAISLVPLVLSILLMADYYTRDIPAGGGMQYQVTLYTITSLNASYTMGADGLNIPLIFLTTMLTTLGLYYSRSMIKKRVKEFFFLFLLLEMGMLGVFVSAWMHVLFYIFWEIGLVPMYFLIGIWGQPKDRPRTPPSSSLSTRWWAQWPGRLRFWRSTSRRARSTSWRPPWLSPGPAT